MKKITFTLLLLNLILAMPLKAQETSLVFSVARVLDAMEINVGSNLVILSDGSFTFSSNTGDFKICGQGGIAGKFKGKLSQDLLAKLIEAFDKLDSDCKNLKNCQAGGVPTQMRSYWKITGWKERSDKIFYFKDDNALPALLGLVLDHSSKFIEEEVETLSIKMNKEKDGNINISLHYHGSNSYQVILGDDVFLVYGQDGVKPFKNKKATGQNNKPSKKTLRKGESFSMSFSMTDYDLKSGDELIYRPTPQDLNPCLLIP